MFDSLAALTDFADSCIRCGLCAKTDCGNYTDDGPCLGDVCEAVYNGTDEFESFPFTCALCNRCTVSCPVDLKAIDGMKPARAVLMNKYPHMRDNYRHFRTDLKYNLFSMMQALDSGDISSVHLIEGELLGNESADSTAFFPGCSLRSYGPELARAAFAWLRDNSIASRMLNFCCGATFFDVGFFEEFKAYKQKACSYLKSFGIKRLIIVCPHCGYELPQLLDGADIEILRLPELMVSKGAHVAGFGTYSVHDACYDRLDGHYGAAARRLMADWTEVPLAHACENTICCGGGGMVSAYAPDFCEFRRNKRLDEIDAVQSDVLISTCFSCVNSMQRGSSTKPVRHYLELVFGLEVDWPRVYAGVDAMYRHPLAGDLLQSAEPIFEEN